MISTKDPEVKKQVKRRLARIEGQLRGVQKMIDEDRDCTEIIQQLIAIRAGVKSASLNYMQDVARNCLLDLDDRSDPQAQRELMTELIQMLGKVS